MGGLPARRMQYLLDRGLKTPVGREIRHNEGMAISTTDRKLLWARSGGFCAKCRRLLTEEVKGDQRLVVIGVEAHIVSGRTGGPRYRRLPPAEVDSYTNLILLCPDDHTLIDKRPDLFPEDVLHDLKMDHERWVKQHRDPMARLRIRNLKPGVPVVVNMVTTGQELMTELGQCLSSVQDYPEPVSREEASQLASFLGGIHDWCDIWSEIGPGERVKVEFDLSSEIEEMSRAGFTVYVGHRDRILEGGHGSPLRWREAIVLIRRIEAGGGVDDFRLAVQAS